MDYCNLNKVYNIINVQALETKNCLPKYDNKTLYLTIEKLSQGFYHRGSNILYLKKFSKI